MANRRVAAVAIAVAVSCGPTALATAGSPVVPTAGTTAHDSVEVWRLHPNKQAARAAHLTLRISDVDAGDRGALMVVEDRHIPVTPFDTAGVYGFAYAELGNDDDYPRVYDNPDHVSTPECPLPSSCLGLAGSPMSEAPLTFTFSKVVDEHGRPFPYDFHDFYVGAVNAHLTVVPTSPGWSVSRASGAEMVLVQNSDTANGIGVRTANYTVEQFNGQIAVSTRNAAWSEAFVGLPCSDELVPVPLPQSRATFSGFTFPYGRPSIPLSCSGNHFDEGMASGPTTWRLTSQPTGGPGNAGAIAATQNLNRMVVLVVDRPKPAKRR
jgi:hypothetical protein